MPLTRSQRDQWAEELESGRWKQARNKLRNVDENAFCCLAVLSYDVLGHDPSQLYYPTEVLDEETMWRFESMNDRERLTFPEIAKHVRMLPVSEEKV